VFGAADAIVLPVMAIRVPRAVETDPAADKFSPSTLYALSRFTRFVNLLGFTPMQAIQAATRQGGQLMGRPDDLGCVAPGYLADLLLVDGDPLADIRILQDAGRLMAIMKGGRFHKVPAAQRTKSRRVAAE